MGKSATAAMSLPMGGGALRGLGESFSPDLHTGTGNLNVPIEVPSGRNGFQPALSLSYSTGHPNSVFGLGWQLSVPGVSRKTSAGIPRYRGDDVFVLSGTEDLVPVTSATDPPGETRYRPCTEGLFARIVHHTGGSGDFWEVWSRDGLRSRYGSERPLDAADGWRDHAAVSDPDDFTHIFAWHLSRTTDTFGNVIEYQYERDAEQVDGPHRWDQIYLKEVRYADYGPKNSPGFLFHVTFSYYRRPDPFSTYRSGFEIRTVRRCSEITVSLSAPDAETEAVRKVHLRYQDQKSGTTAGVSVGASLLAEIQVEGCDPVQPQWLPVLELDYSGFVPGRRRYRSVAGAVPEKSLANSDLDLVDLFGCGLPSVMQLGSSARYWRNLGDGRLDFPRTMTSAPAGAQLGSSGVMLADMDGDARMDLLVSDGARAGYYPLDFAGGWDPEGFRRYERLPGVVLTDPELRLVDLNGDGRVDVLRTGRTFELYYNTEDDEGWSELELRGRGPADVFPNVNFSDPRVRLADMTGDGQQDIVLVHSGRIDYWPNLGYGKWGRRVTMMGSPRFGDPAGQAALGYDPRRLLFGDLDGDGCADLVYVESGQVTVWLNQAGNAWGELTTVRGTPAITDLDALRLTDLDGTGTVGILWSGAAGTYRDGNYKFLDLTGGIKPYLLTRIDNHRGAITEIHYAPSTRYYLEDDQDIRTRWRTTLPFPVHVVARMTVNDVFSNSKVTTEYSYHHGYWDGGDREFRGFARVDQRDTTAFDGSVAPSDYSPPTLTRTWFHLGPVGPAFGNWYELDLSDEFWPGDPPLLPTPANTAALLPGLPRRAQRDATRALRGRTLRTELYGLDGGGRQDRPYTITETHHAVSPLPVGDPMLDEAAAPWQLHVFFPHQLSQRTTQWERGDEPMTNASFTGGHDRYGRPTFALNVAVPRGRQPRERLPEDGEPYLMTLTNTDYVTRDDSTGFLTDRVARVTNYELLKNGRFSLPDLPGVHSFIERKVTGQTLNFYDGEPFEGLPWGLLGVHGALTCTESLVLTAGMLAKFTTDPTDPVAEVPPYLLEPANRSTGGLRGEYFAGTEHNTLLVTRTDPTVDFNWGNGSPDPVVPANGFSARWTGTIRPRFSETYTFATISDDGVRLWVDGKLIIGGWVEHASQKDIGIITLEADRAYPIVLEFFEKRGGAVMQLLWSSARQAREVVPADRLDPLLWDLHSTDYPPGFLAEVQGAGYVYRAGPPPTSPASTRRRRVCAMTHTTTPMHAA